MFKRQLADNTGNVMLTNPPSASELGSDFSALQDANMFVNAANLASGDARTSDTLRDHNLGSLENAVHWLFGIRGAMVEDTVYMPAHKTLSTERGE